MHIEEGYQVVVHFVIFVFIISIITKQVVDHRLWRRMGSQLGISHCSGVGWVTELSSLWHAEDLPVKKARAVLAILKIFSVVTGNSYQHKQCNPHASLFLSTNHQNNFTMAKQNDIRKGLKDFEEAKSPPQTLQPGRIILGCMPISNFFNPHIYSDSSVNWVQLYSLIQSSKLLKDALFTHFYMNYVQMHLKFWHY